MGQHRDGYYQDYRRAKLDSVSIAVPKGERDIWRQGADAAGVSLAAYVSELVRRDLRRRGLMG